MAVVESSINISKAMTNLPVIKQIGLLIGLAASIAIGVGVADWSKSPDYRVLYSSLLLEDSQDVVSVLDRVKIKYRISEASGSVMVPANDLQEARMMLASEGLPKGTGSGYEILEKDIGFGISHFMENIRYQRALEGELSRTITSIKSIRSARVHLAIPKNSSFLRKKKKVKASVSIDLFPGRNIDTSQISSIAYLVAASIPDLEARDVVIVDQKGKLLSNIFESNEMQRKSTQLDYKKSLEKYYINRIENILIPILGAGSIRAQVSASIDFTVTEQTQETFNPDLPAIRSEQITRSLVQGLMTGGIPGSLSNQPGQGSLNEGGYNSQKSLGNTSSKSVRNYELDKTISHTRYGGNTLRRLSVAVVVNNEMITKESGEKELRPLDEKKLKNIKELVKESIGFDISRGDTISIINVLFYEDEVVEEELIEVSFMDNQNFMVIGKYVGAAFIILLLVFGLLKPIMKELLISSNNVVMEQSASGTQKMTGDDNKSTETTDNDYEANIKNAQTLATENPKRVAQVVNTWVATDG